MPDENLIIKAIESVARLDARIGSIDISVTMLRTENEKILGKISESLEKLAAIQEKLSANASDHLVLHKRIDDVKVELATIEGDVDAIQHTCQAANHGELLRRVQSMERQLNAITDALKVVTWKIKGIPVWQVVVGMVIMGFVIDMISHRDLISKIWPF